MRHIGTYDMSFMQVRGAKLALIAPTWRALYKDEVRKLMTHAHGPQTEPQRAGVVLPELDTWKLSRVKGSLAAERQT